MRLHRWSTREGTRGIRAFADLYDKPDGRHLVSTRFEGYVASGARHTGIGLTTDEDSRGVQFFVGAGRIACCWLSVGVPPLLRWVYARWEKGLPDVDIADVRLHDRAVWWSLWHDKHVWHSSTPRWRNGSFHWWNWLTGKPVYSTEVTEGPIDVVIPMPEGVYEAAVTLERSTWKRPRWPWLQIRHGYDVHVISRPSPDGPYVPENSGTGEPRSDGYIPVPGKGENAWDCGGDGIFSQSGPGRTVEAAIAGVIESALRDRRRRGAPLDYSEVIS
jgi:hypothetical protein